MPRLLVAAAALIAAAFAGCGQANVDTEVRGHTLTIYYGVPLHGPDAERGRAAVAGAKRALANAGGEAAEFRVEPVFLDDTGGRDERFDSRVTADGARRAAQDVTALAYVGDFSAQASRFSLPITNQAAMPQLVPARVLAELTGGRGPAEDLLLPSGSNTAVSVPGTGAEFGRRATSFLVRAIEAAGDRATERAVILDQLRRLAG
jgi:ABC-type branched-subunit amino acid transport system substrate-binding protein